MFRLRIKARIRRLGAWGQFLAYLTPFALMIGVALSIEDCQHRKANIQSDQWIFMNPRPAFVYNSDYGVPTEIEDCLPKLPEDPDERLDSICKFAYRRGYYEGNHTTQFNLRENSSLTFDRPYCYKGLTRDEQEALVTAYYEGALNGKKDAIDKYNEQVRAEQERRRKEAEERAARYYHSSASTYNYSYADDDDDDDDDDDWDEDDDEYENW